MAKLYYLCKSFFKNKNKSLIFGNQIGLINESFTYIRKTDFQSFCFSKLRDYGDYRLQLTKI